MHLPVSNEKKNTSSYERVSPLVLHAKIKKDEKNTDSIGCLSADWVLFQ
jgi:hypothetical protein